MEDAGEIDFTILEDDELENLLSSFQFEDPTPIRTSDCKSLNILGVPVEFPYNPYKSQMQMMEHIISGVQKGENCLLESPTGTGKTAAILCSLLAWQRKCKELGSAYWEIKEDPSNSNPCICKFADFPDVHIVQVPDKKGNFDLLRSAVEDEDFTGSDDENNKWSPSKKRKVILIPEERRTRDQLCGSCLKKYFKESTNPRIYYATRTHSQIAQVIKQLKVTDYANVSMTILASRQQTCVNKDVLKTPPKSGLDHRCKILRNGYYRNLKPDEKKRYPQCRYFNEYSGNFLGSFPQGENNRVWDIEDILEYGKDHEKCPFYGVRELHPYADIVFIPYNYLLDRLIRSSTKIRYPNSILVFDEAHNIEQICCDSMSIEIPLEFVDKIRLSFDSVLLDPTVPKKILDALRKFTARLQRLSKLLIREGSALKDERIFDGTIEGSKTFSGNAIIELLKNLGFGVADIPGLREDLNDLDDKNEANEKSKVYFAPEHIKLFDNLITVLGIIYSDQNMKRLSDFRACIQKKSTGVPDLPFSFTFSLFCLNAGIAFEALRDSARTIIVTSGTLSPTLSFASELETKFQQVLSAQHVVGGSQVWAGIITKGLTPNLSLELNSDCLRKNQAVLQELGQIILRICKIVPNGVLVFLPSYQTIDRLKNQWSKVSVGSEKSVLEQLQRLKTVFYEESSNVNIDVFKESMKRYQEQVLVGHGAVLFAVFRGKVSEGVDFKDDQARAVVTIGIPYPYHGIRIKLKKCYNDLRKLKEPYLNGQEWYKVNAFRAMNQAFGRCLRHSNDWGALILIDSRIPQNCSKLSNWIVKYLQKHDTATQVLNSLREFMEKKQVEVVPQVTFELLNHEMATQLIPGDEMTTQLIPGDEMFSMDHTTQPLENFEMCDDVHNQRTQPILSQSQSQATQPIDEDEDDALFSNITKDFRY